jgi:hypothetical protein
MMKEAITFPRRSTSAWAPSDEFVGALQLEDFPRERLQLLAFVSGEARAMPLVALCLRQPPRRIHWSLNLRVVSC